MNETESSVNNFLDAIADSARQEDSRELVALMKAATGVQPKMWGTIIGFGTHHYKYETGREGDTVAVGFSPRKAALVLYGVAYDEHGSKDIAELDTYKLGKGCLYIKRLADVDKELLAQLISGAYVQRNNTEGVS